MNKFTSHCLRIAREKEEARLLHAWRTDVFMGFVHDKKIEIIMHWRTDVLMGFVHDRKIEIIMHWELTF